MPIVILIIVIGIVCVYLIGIYNKLVQMRNLIKNAFAQIDVQLKRRYDLIPNLVETAKGYLKHEKETLEMVIKARNLALGAEQSLAQNPTSPQQFKNLMQAEGGLQQALSKLLVVMENYPELKGNTNMLALMEELTSTENKISFSRQAYNDAVMEYNNQREMFPHSIVASKFGFEVANHFEIAQSNERENIKVSF